MENCLREFRRRHRLTLEDVSGLVGISVPMLSRVERGERNFSPLRKVAVAKRLGVPVGELFPPEPLEEEESAA